MPVLLWIAVQPKHLNFGQVKLNAPLLHRNQCKKFPVYAYEPQFHYSLQARDSYQIPMGNVRL